MNLDKILSEIDQEIARLQQAKLLLSDISTASPAVKRGPGRPPASSTHAVVKHVTAAAKPTRRRTMSAAGRARIAAAQKARWAKVKKAAKKTVPPVKKAAAKKAAKKIAKPAEKKSVAVKPDTTASTAA